MFKDKNFELIVFVICMFQLNQLKWITWNNLFIYDILVFIEWTEQLLDAILLKISVPKVRYFAFSFPIIIKEVQGSETIKEIRARGRIMTWLEK